MGEPSVRRNLVLPLAVTIAASALATPLTVSPAQADGIVSLPIAGFSDILVDQAHGHVFITGGTGSSSIVVTNLDGAIQTSIPNAYGAAQMLLSQDGTKVYVGLTQADGVGVIDTTTLAMTKVSTGATTCPYDVAETAGRIWYSYSCTGSGGVGYISTSDNSVHAGIRNEFGRMTLESSPNLPGEVVLARVGTSPGQIYIATVTEGEGGAVTLPTRVQVEVDARDLAITPDGSRIVTTEMAPYEHPVYLTADLSADGSYATDAYPNAVAIRADGMVAAGIDGDPDIWLYQAGSRELFRSYTFSSPSMRVAEGGLAFGSTRLYAIEQTGYWSDATYRLRVITPRGKSTVTIKASAATYSFGATAKATVHLTSTSPNRQVSVYATPYGGTEKLIRTANVDAGGNLTASTAVTRRTTFRVAYAGDANVDPSTASTTAAVRAKVTPAMKNYFGRSGSYYLYHPAKVAALVGTVAPNHGGDCLYFKAQYYGGGAWRYLGGTGCVHMTSTSRAAGLLDSNGLVGVKVRMRAEWRGNTENAAKNSAWRYLKFVR